MKKAFPAVDFTCADSKTVHTSSRVSLTENVDPPAQCTVQEDDSYDQYGVIIPTEYSDLTCSNASGVLNYYTSGILDAWECKPYGAWIPLMFKAHKHTVVGVRPALGIAFPGFDFYRGLVKFFNRAGSMIR